MSSVCHCSVHCEIQTVIRCHVESLSQIGYRPYPSQQMLFGRLANVSEALSIFWNTLSNEICVLASRRRIFLMLDVIKALTKKRDELLAEADKIENAIVALGHKMITKKRKVSAAARKKMSQAAKARWANKKKAA